MRLNQIQFVYVPNAPIDDRSYNLKLLFVDLSSFEKSDDQWGDKLEALWLYERR